MYEDTNMVCVADCQRMEGSGVCCPNLVQICYLGHDGKEHLFVLCVVNLGVKNSKHTTQLVELFHFHLFWDLGQPWDPDMPYMSKNGQKQTNIATTGEQTNESD